MGKIAIIGNADSVLAFKAGGADAYGAKNAAEAKEKLKEIAAKYSVIFITDDLTAEMDGYLKRFSETAYPIVLPVPGKNGSSGYSAQKLKERSERALGIDILFEKSGKEEK